MWIPGTPIPDDDIFDLASRLHRAGFDSEAEELEQTYLDGDEARLVLGIEHREAIVRVLDDCPDGPLAELRGKMLREISWLRKHREQYGPLLELGDVVDS
jgi:hypothetical protein